MRFRALLAVLLLLAVRAWAEPAHPEALVLVLGDQHSGYERTAQLVGLVDQLKAAHPGLPLAIILDGDTQEYGNVIARRSGGAIDFAMYAALARRAPTILNLGNHEPEFYDLAETVRRIEATGVRVVGNITNHATGQLFAPAVRKLALGASEATVVGVSTDVLSIYRVAVRPSLDLTKPAVWARANFPTLFAGAKLPIVVSHAGIAADREMFPFVPEGALFAGAHDHQRFVEPMGRTVYFHSGSWNSYVSLAWLDRAATGLPRWTVEQVEVKSDGPADPEMKTLVAKVTAEHLTDADRTVVGHLPAALSPAAAARYVLGALRKAAGVDAALVGNTTFGGGLPAGDVTQLQFDACVRFDGAIFVAEVSGARLQQLIAAANLTPETPFAQRKGEFCFAAGPDAIDPARTYRIATNDWGARSTDRYFGEPKLEWREAPGLKLKAAVLSALNPR
ncbi:MAG: 5'-nucleotidase C-terminal domain-containing protein [Lacunisphaera sp.]